MAKVRKTLTQMAQGDEPAKHIAGKPADVCPYCGCAMFATGTRHGEAVTFRYVECRNKSCGRKFYSKQPPATLVRELGVDDDVSASSGQPNLTLRREAG